MYNIPLLLRIVGVAYFYYIRRNRRDDRDSVMLLRFGQVILAVARHSLRVNKSRQRKERRSATSRLF